MAMSAAWAVVIAVACGGAGLDEARELLRKGLLTEAERILAPLAAEAEGRQRAPALLLLGNVDYERGRYESALERYTEAEREGAADDSLVAAARGNRELAQQRLQRARQLATVEARLRAGVMSALALGALAVTWLARRPRIGARPSTGDS
jgi:tetratricopeptide (TPR) repeat protein